MKKYYEIYKHLLRYTFIVSVGLLLMQCNRKLTYRISKTSQPDKHYNASLSQEDTMDLVIDSTLLYKISLATIERSLANEPIMLDSIFLYQKNNNLNGPFPPIKKLLNQTTDFYVANNYQCKWLGSQRPFEYFHTMMEAIDQASSLGLDPAMYKTEQIHTRIKNLYNTNEPNALMIQQADASITYLFFYFLNHVCEGRLDYRGSHEKIWRRYKRVESNISMLQHIHSSKDLSTILNEIHPPYEQYTKLQPELERYRSLEKQYSNVPNTFIELPSTLDPGGRDVNVPLIQRRLKALGYHSELSPEDSLLYNENMTSAVKWFQLHHGLETDGRIGKETLQWLNLTFRERADLIALNMERLRWLPPIQEDQCIIINVPEYQLRLYRNHKVDLSMRVIVGTERTATPIFSDTLKYIVFSPEWSVPQSIIRKEIIERLRRNPSYYQNKGYFFYKYGQQIDPTTVNWNDPELNPGAYRVVQGPGPNNSLGLVKFIMPNSLSIYLHDTPTDYLFNRDQRAFSHGCIRLSEPDKLAKALLQDKPQCNDSFIWDKMHAETPYTVHLSVPTQVLIIYQTAWVDENGFMNFRKDVYGHDQRQLSLLSQASNY